jgi:hypothetical protein
MTREHRRLSRKHDSGELAAQAFSRDRHHDAGQKPGETATGHKRETVETTGETRYTPLSNEIVEAPGGSALWADPQHLVGEVGEEVAARLIGDDRAGPAPAPRFCWRLEGCRRDHDARRCCLGDGNELLIVACDRLTQTRHFTVPF